MSVRFIALCVLFVAWVLKNLFTKWGDYCLEAPIPDVCDFVYYTLAYLYATVRCVLSPAIGSALLYIVFF